MQSSVSTARVKELEALSSRLHYNFCSAAVGSEALVLFESTERDGFMTGFTGNYIKVKHTKANDINDCVKPDGSPIDLDLYMNIIY